MNEISLRQNLKAIVSEYEQKKAALPEELAKFQQAGINLMTACTISGTYGKEDLKTGGMHIHDMEINLLTSAWLHVYNGLRLDLLFSPKDKAKWERSLRELPEFTLDTIRATFGDYVENPRANILRSLAEVFCDLDPYYKSHDKIRIGVKGLPKRVIINNINGIYGHGYNQLKAIIDCLAVYQNKPRPDHIEINNLFDNSFSCIKSRGISLKRYKNGNAHLYFEPDALHDINSALTEYYGNVLADCVDEDEPIQKRAGTAIAKDLQYYPTPKEVVERVLSQIYLKPGDKVIEPSCGCGRFLDEIVKKGANVIGFEVDETRAEIAKSKGHEVLKRNFLEVPATPDYDYVIMNPPFTGKGYMKHINHAFKFLKSCGTLVSILPCTAKYDHGLLDAEFPRGNWKDLPIGSFRESGTNINTGVFTISKK